MGLANSYHKGPRGGGMSKGINPLMHWAASPSPTLRMYYHITIEDRSCFTYNSMINGLFKDELQSSYDPGMGVGNDEETDVHVGF